MNLKTAIETFLELNSELLNYERDKNRLIAIFKQSQQEGLHNNMYPVDQAEHIYQKRKDVDRFEENFKKKEIKFKEANEIIKEHLYVLDGKKVFCNSRYGFAAFMLNEKGEVEYTNDPR